MNDFTLFEQQTEAVTLYFVADYLHVTINRKLNALGIKAFCAEVQRTRGVRKCWQDDCVNPVTENTCFVICFNPNWSARTHIAREEVKIRAIKFVTEYKDQAPSAQLDMFAPLQASLFDGIGQSSARADFYTPNNWRDFVPFLPF